MFDVNYLGFRVPIFFNKGRIETKGKDRVENKAQLIQHQNSHNKPLDFDVPWKDNLSSHSLTNEKSELQQ